MPWRRARPPAAQEVCAPQRTVRAAAGATSSGRAREAGTVASRRATCVGLPCRACWASNPAWGHRGRPVELPGSVDRGRSARVGVGGACTVRARSSSAGLIMPSADYLRRRVKAASMSSETSVRTSARSGQDRRWMNALLRARLLELAAAPTGPPRRDRARRPRARARPAPACGHASPGKMEASPRSAPRSLPGRGRAGRAGGRPTHATTETIAAAQAPPHR